VISPKVFSDERCFDKIAAENVALIAPVCPHISTWCPAYRRQIEATPTFSG
jgi:hypothetical protein